MQIDAKLALVQEVLFDWMENGTDPTVCMFRIQAVVFSEVPDASDISWAERTLEQRQIECED